MIERLIEKACETFRTRVMAVTDQEDLVGEPFICQAEVKDVLKVPFSLEGTNGYLLIEQLADAEPVPPRLAESLVALLAREIALLDSLPMQDEVKNDFVHGLLNGTVPSEPDELLRQGERLGMDLARPRAVLLIDVSRYVGGNEVHTAAVDAFAEQPTDWLRTRYVIRHIVSFFSLPSEAICAYIGGGIIAVLKASTTRDLQSWAGSSGGSDDYPAGWSNLSALKRASKDLLLDLENATGGEIRIGIGRYHPGVLGLARSYQDAKTALAIGVIDGGSRVVCLDDLGMTGLIGITDPRTRQELAGHILGPLDSEPDLLHTLHVYFEENCSPVSTSTRLYIHRNTLTYRLDKIMSLTGLDPKRFTDAMLIRLALILRSLTPAGTGQLPN
jgi:carbohydrate diacid regulator